MVAQEKAQFFSFYMESFGLTQMIFSLSFSENKIFMFL